MSSVTCSVCIEYLNLHPACSLKCGHVFHSTCLDKCMKRKRECPVCRKRVTETGIRKLYFSGIDGEISNEVDDSIVPESSKNNGEGTSGQQRAADSSDSSDSGEESDSDSSGLSDSSDNAVEEDDDEGAVNSEDDDMELDIEDSEGEGMDNYDDEEENVATIIESQTAEIDLLRHQLAQAKTELEASRARELELTAQLVGNSNGGNNSRMTKRQLQHELAKSKSNFRKMRDEHGLALHNVADLQQKLEKANQDKVQELNNIRQNVLANMDQFKESFTDRFKEDFSKAFASVALKRPSNDSSDRSGNDNRECSTSRT
ncbi:ring finger domain-containing protein [Ditylenchus destructor]|nr:ring finger domain-containing protein [Ditylenchus destructor]